MNSRSSMFWMKFDPWEGEEKDNDGELDLDAANNTLETDPINWDTDGDMLGDGDEAYPKTIEQDNITNVKVDGVWYNSNPIDGDTDNDGLSDYHEVVGWDVTIIWEATLETVSGPDRNYSNPNIPDTDGDGLLDGDEYAYSSNPTVSDSDGDNLNDKTEVDIGSDPVGMDGVPPVLSDLSCWVDPIVEKGANKIPYLAGLLIKITVDVTDPACVHYIELEIQNKTERVYVQESQEKTILKNITINITMDYQYDYLEPFIVRLSDFCGNVNESKWIPVIYWPNFKNQHWKDPQYEVKRTGSRSENSESIILPSNKTDEIIDLLKKALLEQEKNIIDYYNLVADKYENLKQIIYSYNHLYETNPFFISYTDPNSILTVLSSKYLSYYGIVKYYQHGLCLNTLTDSISSNNSFMIKNTIQLIGNHDDKNFPFYSYLSKIDKSIKNLEKSYDEDIIDNYILSLKIDLVDIIQKFQTLDEVGVPYLLKITYGATNKFSSIFNSTIVGDTDSDGISNFNEIKIIFRASKENYEYTNDWIAVDIGQNNSLVGFGYSETKQMNLYQNDPETSMKFITRGKTPENYRYFVLQDSQDNSYVVYIVKNIDKNKIATVSIYRENDFNPEDYDDVDLSFFPNWKYHYWNYDEISKKIGDFQPFIDKDYLFLMSLLSNSFEFDISYEVRLCPDANLIIPDIFIEVDWMREGIKWFKWDDNPFIGRFNNKQKYYNGFNHEFGDDGKNKIIYSFAVQLIWLHIDNGNLGGGEPIPFITYLKEEDEERIPGLFFDNNFPKKNYFNSIGRNGIFFYCVIAHLDYEKRDKLNGESGHPFTVYDGNLIFFDPYFGGGKIFFDPEHPTKQGKVLMHELGHDLGLEHPAYTYTSGSTPKEAITAMRTKDNTNYIAYHPVEWREIKINPQ